MNTSSAARTVAVTTETTNAISLVEESAPDKILVKFTFTNKSLLPEGIPEQDRGSDAEVDARHAAVAARAGSCSLAEKGRVRKGRVDTGQQVINDNSGATADFVRRGLAPLGYKLTRVNYYTREDQKTRKTKFTVVLAYDKENEVLDQSWLDRALRDLATMRWDWCNVWENPDGTVTCNFSGRSGAELPPKHHLGVEKKHLMLLPA